MGPKYPQTTLSGACALPLRLAALPPLGSAPSGVSSGGDLFTGGGDGGEGRDASEGKGPQRRPQPRLDRRLEEVAQAVGGGYCRLQMPSILALAVRESVAGHRLGALEWGWPSTASLSLGHMHTHSRQQLVPVGPLISGLVTGPRSWGRLTITGGGMGQQCEASPCSLAIPPPPPSPHLLPQSLPAVPQSLHADRASWPGCSPCFPVALDDDPLTLLTQYCLDSNTLEGFLFWNGLVQFRLR